MSGTIRRPQAGRGTATDLSSCRLSVPPQRLVGADPAFRGEAPTGKRQRTTVLRRVCSEPQYAWVRLLRSTSEPGPAFAHAPPRTMRRPERPLQRQGLDRRRGQPSVHLVCGGEDHRRRLRVGGSDFG